MLSLVITATAHLSIALIARLLLIKAANWEIRPLWDVTFPTTAKIIHFACVQCCSRLVDLQKKLNLHQAWIQPPTLGLDNILEAAMKILKIPNHLEFQMF